MSNKSQYKAYEKYLYTVGIAIAILMTSAIAEPLRDPTMPLHEVLVSEDEVELVLAAIADVGGKSFAIINGQRVYEGEVIKGAKIEKIDDKSVIYSHKGKRHILNMRLSLIK